VVSYLPGDAGRAAYAAKAKRARPKPAGRRGDPQATGDSRPVLAVYAELTQQCRNCLPGCDAPACEHDEKGICSRAGPAGKPCPCPGYDPAPSPGFMINLTEGKTDG
jgi:hypothetical protein